MWSRETDSAVPSRVSLLISILRLNLVLTYGIPPEVRHWLEAYVTLGIPEKYISSIVICNHFFAAVCRLPTAINFLKQAMILYILASTTAEKLLQYWFFVLYRKFKFQYNGLQSTL